MASQESYSIWSAADDQLLPEKASSSSLRGISLPEAGRSQLFTEQPDLLVTDIEQQAAPLLPQTKTKMRQRIAKDTVDSSSLGEIPPSLCKTM